MIEHGNVKHGMFNSEELRQLYWREIAFTLLCDIHETSSANRIDKYIRKQISYKCLLDFILIPAYSPICLQ